MSIREIPPSGSSWNAAGHRRYLQWMLKPKLHPRVPLARQRRWLEQLSAAMPLPRDVRLEPATVAGRPCEWLRARGTPVRRGSVLYLHGGAYCVGSPATHRNLTTRFARELGLPVFALDYRLAPEHPYPAALEDAMAAFDALASQGPVVLAGDSAGGGLALATALALRDRAGIQPAALWLLSPWADMAAELPAEEPAGEAMLQAEWIAACAAHYRGSLPAEQPGLSPLRAELRGLPPVLLQFGTDERLHGQGLALHAALEAAGVAVEAEVYQQRWHVFQLSAGWLQSADDALCRAARFLQARLTQGQPQHEVLVMGAGMSGLCMAVQLKKAGIEDFVILEKSAGIGGTWWDNRYPGAQVDVPAPTYAFSFAPNRRASQRFANAPEIQRYLQELAEREHLPARMRLGVAVMRADFDAEAGLWRVALDTGETLTARFFVCSTGPLSRPRFPDIAGLEQFAGRLLHSARWPADARPEVELQGQRIGIIGTGSTASQLVPPLACAAASFKLFQRTPNWILPRQERRYTAVDRWLVSLPGLARIGRWCLSKTMELLRLGFNEGSLARRVLLGQAESLRRKQVADPALRQALTPPYPLGCKRLIFSNDYYPALTLPQSHVVTSAISRVTATGLLTADGEVHELDVLVCATGFDTVNLLGELPITGLGGQRLAERWAAGPWAYRGLTVPGFPNLFLMLGPNTATGHTSTLFFIEPQCEHAIACMQRVRSEGRRWVQVREDVAAAEDAAQQQRLKGSIWSQCQSWYRGADGRVIAIFPGFTGEYVRSVRRPDWAAYELG